MDEYKMKGAVEESSIDSDRIIHTETVKVTPEENSDGKIESSSHPETREESIDSPTNETLQKEEETSNSLRDKVQSMAAIFTSVAVTAVVVVAVAFSDAPIVNVSALNIGSDYVEYTADITNETGDSLILSISNDYQNYEKKISKGEVTDVVKDLKPDTKYDFTIRAANGFKQTFFSKSFQTAKSDAEYPARVTDVITSRDDTGKLLYLQFQVSDIYSYYKNYKLLLKNGEEIEAEIPIQDITNKIEIDLNKYTKSSYSIQLTADTTMPSDNDQKVFHKTVYTAKLEN